MIDRNTYKQILKSPDWYLQLSDFLTEHFFEFTVNRVGKPRSWYEESEAFEELVLESIKDGTLTFSSQKIGVDKDRKPIDTIIIHHTGRESDEDFERGGEALSLLRHYAKSFSNPKNHYYGKQITSDHYYDNRMTFVPYHYVIWPDGRVVNYLKDEYLAWHAGMEYNPSSIAVCFHGDFENSRPSDEAIAAAKKILASYKNVTILGHREVSTTTDCPGNMFLGLKGWKQELF